MVTTTSRGPGTSTFFYMLNKTWATKPSNFTRNCFPFRLRARRTPLWGAETFGSHRPYGLPSWHPSLGCRASVSIAPASKICLRHVVRYSYEMTFPCPQRPLWGESKSDQVLGKFFFFFLFELEVYCPLCKQQDMIVQLSVTSYVYHLLTQEKVDNRLASWSEIIKTEGIKPRPSRPAEKRNHGGSGRAGKGQRRELLRMRKVASASAPFTVQNK